MQQLTEINVPPVLPRHSSTSGDIYFHSIEAEALALEADLSSGNLTKTKAALSQLQLLSGMAGRRGRLQAMITAAIAKAQHHIDELESEERRRGSADIEGKFESLVYIHMSVEARRFYHEINADANYTIAPVSDDGEIIHHAAKNVGGKTLRHRMSLIKFHSLETEHKKQVLHQTVGAVEAEGEGTPKDKKMLEKKKKDLYALHDALDDMEAYKALMILRKYPPDVVAKMIKKNHEIIARAHAQIDEVIRKYDDLIGDLNNNMALATLKAAKLKMKQMLKDEVIDQVLLEQTANPHAISGGVGVVGTVAATTGVGFAAVPNFFQPFSN